MYFSNSPIAVYTKACCCNDKTCSRGRGYTTHLQNQHHAEATKCRTTTCPPNHWKTIFTACDPCFMSSIYTTNSTAAPDGTISISYDNFFNRSPLLFTKSSNSAYDLVIVHFISHSGTTVEILREGAKVSSHCRRLTWKNRLGSFR